jgi:hypothetical protein
MRSRYNRKGKLTLSKYLDYFSLFQYVLDIDVFADNVRAGTKVASIIRRLTGHGLAVFLHLLFESFREFMQLKDSTCWIKKRAITRIYR